MRAGRVRASRDVGLSLLAALLLLLLPPASPAALAAGGVVRVDPAGGGAALTAALAQARDGDTVVLGSGLYAGNFTIARSIRLVGEGEPVLDGGGKGTVLRVQAPDVEVRGLRIRGSGRSLDREESGIMVERPEAVIAGNRLEDVLFGIYLRGAARSRVTGNRLESKAIDQGLRGDGIRLWESSDSQVAENRVSGFRQVIIQHSDGSRIESNEIDHAQIGIHLMTSHRLRVAENQVESSDVGIYAMYGSRVELIRNRVRESRGPSGYGIGLKDMDDIAVEENLLARNRVGIYLDNSPRAGGSATNLIRRNLVQGNDRALVLQPGVTGNIFTGNGFTANLRQVAFNGGGDGGLNRWSQDGAGNYWSDYAGYDADGDGRGDLPYRPRSLFEGMQDRRPELAWFSGTPTAALVEWMARVLPVLSGPPRVDDPAPLMVPPPGAEQSERGGSGSPGLPVVLLLAGLLTPALVALAGPATLSGVRRRAQP